MFLIPLPSLRRGHGMTFVEPHLTCIRPLCRSLVGRTDWAMRQIF